MKVTFYTQCTFCTKLPCTEHPIREVDKLTNKYLKGKMFVKHKDCPQCMQQLKELECEK